MQKYPRSIFFKNIAALTGAALTGSAFYPRKKHPLLSFSTLGCPDWTFEQVIQFAHDHHYDGVEIRGIRRELDLPKCPQFSSAANIKATKQLVNDHGIKMVNLGASSSLHHSDPSERKKNIDDAKRFIDLAEQLSCPYIRVFPNDFPKDQARSTTIELISKGLLELGDFAKRTNVTVLMESHGQVVRTDDLETIMRNAEHQHVGLIWDIVNMWSVTKEDPEGVFRRLKKYIRHTHIKDMKVVVGKEQYVLLGGGDTPVFKAIDSLFKGGYEGYFSFEWEKLWHPEIPAPEIALADYPRVIKKHFASL